MRKFRPCYGLVVALSVVAMAGCGPSDTGTVGADTGANIQSISQISELYARATAPPEVHRFRKQRSDRRALAMRQLSNHCDRLAGDIRTGQVSAEALIGPTGDEIGTADSGALETALVELANAARAKDAAGMRSAHAAVLAASGQ